MYIMTSESNNGVCGQCLGITRDPVQSGQFRSSGESCTEEESSNGGTEFSDK